MFGYEPYEAWAEFRRLLTRCTHPKRRGRRQSARAEGGAAGTVTGSGNDGGREPKRGS